VHVCKVGSGGEPENDRDNQQQQSSTSPQQEDAYSTTTSPSPSNQLEEVSVSQAARYSLRSFEDVFGALNQPPEPLIAPADGDEDVVQEESMDMDLLAPRVGERHTSGSTIASIDPGTVETTVKCSCVAVMQAMFWKGCFFVLTPPRPLSPLAG